MCKEGSVHKSRCNQRKRRKQRKIKKKSGAGVGVGRCRGATNERKENNEKLINMPWEGGGVTQGRGQPMKENNENFNKMQCGGSDPLAIVTGVGCVGGNCATNERKENRI